MHMRSFAKIRSRRVMQLLLTWSATFAAAEPTKGLLRRSNPHPVKWEDYHEYFCRDEPPHLLKTGWRRYCCFRRSWPFEGILARCEAPLLGAFQCISVDRQERTSHCFFREDRDGSRGIDLAGANGGRGVGR